MLDPPAVHRKGEDSSCFRAVFSRQKAGARGVRRPFTQPVHPPRQAPLANSYRSRVNS